MNQVFDYDDETNDIQVENDSPSDSTFLRDGIVEF
jgi:hypothetical protein